MKHLRLSGVAAAVIASLGLAPVNPQHLGQPCCSPSNSVFSFEDPDCDINIVNLIMSWGKCSGFCQTPTSPCTLHATVNGTSMDLGAQCDDSDFDFRYCDQGFYAVVLNCADGCD
jgi:hypothetical protein